VYLEAHIGNLTSHLNFLIVPNLTYDVILGVEALNHLQAVINLNDNIIECTNNNNEKQYLTIINKDPSSRLEINFTTPVIKATLEKPEASEQNNFSLITPDQKIMLDNLLKKFHYLNRDEIGLLDTYTHQIILNKENLKPFCKSCIPLKNENFNKALDIINKWLLQGIIEESNSCYVNSLLFVEKHDGSLRPCLNPCTINEHTLPEYFTPERIDDVLKSLKNVRYISVLDLRSSFLQVPLHPNSRPLTAFKFNHKVYHFTRVPFGIRNSLSAFIQALNPLIPSDLKDNIRNYVDDILIVSPSFEEHIEHLTKIFQNLLVHGATLNFDKCQFFKSSVKFLGHIISVNGISKDPEKIQAIQDFPRPSSPKDVQSFIGLLNFYNKFSEKFSQLSVPLTELTKKQKKWTWESKHEESFIKLKQEFSKQIYLSYIDFSLPFFVQSDASDLAVGGIVYQMGNNNEKSVIACYSKKLSEREARTYSVTEKELYAVVVAVKKFYDILAGNEIFIYTDHQALSHLFSCRNPPPRIYRWLIYLLPLNLIIKHVSGKSNKVADILSRTVNSLNFNKSISPIFDRVIKEQDKPVNEALTKRTNFQVIDDVQYMRLNNKWLVHIPEHLIDPLIETIHQHYCHVGVSKTYRLITEQFYCKSLKKYIKRFIKICHTCQLKKPSACETDVEGSIHARDRLDLVSMDYFGPLPEGQYKFKYILVIIDNFTRYVTLYPTRSVNLSQTKRCFLKYANSVSDVGNINKVLTDNATTFTSHKWKTFLDDLNITRILTPIRRPKCNLSERVNRDIVTYLRILLEDQHNGWVKHVKRIQDTLNTTYHSSIQNVPYNVFHGMYSPRIWKNKKQDNSRIPPTLHEKMLEELKQVNSQHKLNSEAKTANLKCRLKVGDLVLVKAINYSSSDQNRVGKLCDKFEGPYCIKEKLGKFTFLLVFRNGIDVRGIFHCSLLKKYFE